MNTWRNLKIDLWSDRDKIILLRKTTKNGSFRHFKAYPFGAKVSNLRMVNMKEYYTLYRTYANPNYEGKIFAGITRLRK